MMMTPEMGRNIPNTEIMRNSKSPSQSTNLNSINLPPKYSLSGIMSSSSMSARPGGRYESISSLNLGANPFQEYNFG